MTVTRRAVVRGLVAALAGAAPRAVAPAGAGVSPARGHWVAAAPLPTPRTEVAAAATSGRIYVAGGFTGDGKATSIVEAFDVASGRWRRPAALPAPRHHVGLAAVGGRLYAIGGYDGEWRPSPDTFAYDAGADRWTRVAPLATARGALSVAVLRGQVHAVGGVGAGRRNTGALESYDPVADRWLARAPLPTPRDHLAAAVTAAGFLLAVGGRLDGSYARNLAVVEVYDPATDRWHAGQPLPAPRSGIAGALVAGAVVVLGGESPDRTYADAFAYGAEAERWTALAPMPTARHGLGAATHAGRLHVLGGGPTPGLSVTSAHEILELA